MYLEQTERQRRYDQLTPAQQDQVAGMFSADALLGNDPAGYLYELGTDEHVLCRRRLTHYERTGAPVNVEAAPHAA